MPLYVSLFKFTDQGRKTIKESPRRLREATARLEKTLGIKLLQAVYTTGQYDLVAIFEAPNDEAALVGGLGTTSAGNVQAETLHGYTIEQMEKIVSKIP